MKPETYEHLDLPSGKRIARRFDANGQLISEVHSYGLIDISIDSQFRDGVKVAEIYIVKKQIASRKRYEKAREAYPDMPPADTAIDDFGARLLKDLRAERRQQDKVAREHVPDPEAAARIDDFCRSLLNKGKKANAESWIESTQHTVGELTHAKSRKLIERLLQRGAKRVFVCDIDKYENDEENTGHLVIELPDDIPSRRSLIKELDRLATTRGFRGELDNGQRYAYAGLD